MSKLARYPAEYSKLLLSLAPDGSPFDVTLSSPAVAQAERLAFYNFLKFLRRNPVEARPFGSRPSLVKVSLVGSTLRFELRVSAMSSLANALKDHLTPVDLPGSVGVVPDVSDTVDLPDTTAEDAAQQSALDILDKALGTGASRTDAPDTPAD